MKASCYYCSSKNLTRAYQSLNFYKCEKCNIYARYPMPSSKELAVHYKSNYSYKNMTTNKIHQTSSISFNKIMAKYIFKKIMSKKQGTKLLDYGSGIGNLIYELMKFSNKRFSKKIVSRKLKKNNYDIVTIIEVIEHLKNPWADLHHIYQSMNKGGVIIITTPNIKGMNAKITGSKWREQLEPTHLVLFEKKTISMLLTNIGFKQIEFIRFYPVSYNNKLKQLKNIFFQLLGWHGGICVIATK